MPVIPSMAPIGAAEDARLDDKRVKFIEDGETVYLSNSIILTAYADNDASHMSYNLSYKGKNVFTYLGFSPNDNMITDTDVVFVDSLTKKAKSYISKTGAEYVIIKSEENEQIGNKHLINAVYTGIVSVHIGRETEVVSVYDGYAVSE